MRDWLLPRLEQAGLCVCIDFRDFELGMPILTSIEDAAAQSRRALLVLTPDWVKSEWVSLESLMMQSDDPANQKGRILPILLEPCDVPRRLAVLNHLDMTDPTRREAQVALLTDFLQKGIPASNRDELNSVATIQPAVIPKEPYRDLSITSVSSKNDVDDRPNPFVWRGAIKVGNDFFNRQKEQRRLKLFLAAGQNCQIVGPRRIGKSSLLRQVERCATTWTRDSASGSVVAAYIDLQDPRCHSLKGLLHQIASQLGCPDVPEHLNEFMEMIEDILADDKQPVLLLDEFQELTARPDQFPHEFFLTLRACGQRGVSIFTASREPLSELVDQSDKIVSQFYNIFPLLRLEIFSREDSQAFLLLPRTDITPFSPLQINTLIDFGRGQPLALQVAAFNATESINAGDTDALLTEALRRADDEMRSLMKSRW